MVSNSHSVDEELFKVIGSFGTWQKVILSIFLYVNILETCINYSMTFLAPNVAFRCVHPNVSYSKDSWPGQCSVPIDHGDSNWTENVPCTQWEYDTSMYSDTLVNKWDLVCDREWLISFSKSVFMIGYLAAVFVFGQVSDRLGRFKTIVLCYLIASASTLLSLFSTSVTVFLIFRFLQALGWTGTATTGFVLTMEMVGPRYRTSVSIVNVMAWCLGMLPVLLIGYFLRHWFWFQLAIFIPALPILFTYRLIPESPRWLITHKKLDALKKLIVLAAEKNGMELKEDPDEILKRLVSVNIEKKSTIVDLFRTAGMRAKAFNMMYLWAVDGFVYYSLSYNTNDLSGNSYLNFLISGLLTISACCLHFFALPRFGRRATVVTLMVLGGAFCIAILPVPDDMAWLSITLTLSGWFCVTASFVMLYIYTGELFPTVVRNTALGVCSTTARVGSAVGPFSRELGKASYPFVPNILYGVLAVTSGLFALRLPETLGRNLPDTLEEEKAFEKERVRTKQERDQRTV